jgi:N-acyl-D-aspartate/D-glutamate deacylase
MFDLLILGGTIVDGTGGPRYTADLGIKNGKIAKIGSLKNEDSKEFIDAQGLIVSPGFIDCHTHSDFSLLRNPSAIAKLSQGVTTEIIGNCGMSAAPIYDTTEELMLNYVKSVLGERPSTTHWESTQDYLAVLRSQTPAVNVGVLIGHGTVRTAVMGFENRKPTPSEMEEMKEYIREAMLAGAIGFSTGLSYAPGAYSQTEEIIELAKVAAQYNGVYVTHLRDQVDGLVQSVQEAIEIGKGANIPIVISHHKTVGIRNFGKVNDTLKLLDDVMENGGIETCSDTYPYITGSTTLASVLPPWVQAGGIGQMQGKLIVQENRDRIKNDFRDGIKGWENRPNAIGWDNIIVTATEKQENKYMEGKSIQECSLDLGKDPVDFVLDLLVEEGGNICIIFNNSCESDLITVLSHPRTMVGSDGLDVGLNPHPRLYGTFPKVLKEYVREKGVLTLEEGIYKMTGLSAKQFHLAEVGFIKEGMRADVTIFDSNEIEDLSSYNESRKLSKGIHYVMISGQVAYKEDGPTGVRAGEILNWLTIKS